LKPKEEINPWFNHFKERRMIFDKNDEIQTLQLEKIKNVDYNLKKDFYIFLCV